MDKNYRLAESFGRQNIQDRLWYCDAETDKAAMLLDKECNLIMGDKVYVIATGSVYIIGSDKAWHAM